MHRAQVVDFFDRYARSFGAPVRGETRVERVFSSGDGYQVVTDQGTWFTTNVVIATGATDTPRVPRWAAGLTPDIEQVTPNRYRAPSSVRDGGVLVVGASATGVQLADELAGAGRSVVLAVGAHTRGVRTYRGLDVFRWLEATGKNDTPLAALADPDSGPRAPSLQVIGGTPPVAVDLRALQDRGVELTGHGLDSDGTRVRFADDLVETTARADAGLRRLLREFDRHAAAAGGRDLPDDGADARVIPVRVPARRRTELDLRDAGISTVVWATGYGRDYSWLDVPVLDRRGELVQTRGVTAAPGLYVVGLRFQSRRNSNFIDGVGHDARAVVDHLTRRRRDSVRVAV